MTTTLLLLLFSIFSITDSTRRGVTAHYRTAYACEGRDLNITCKPGYRINLIRANFGRFSIALCNENGALDWSVDCMSKITSRVMQDRCNMKNSCGLPASSLVFGDPCPGTLKYLEAQYRCVPEIISTTTRRPPPKIFFPTTRPPNTKSTTEFRNSLKTSITITQASYSTTTTTTTVSSALKPTRIPVQVILTDVPLGDPLIITFSNNSATKYCPPVTSRGLFWNWTRIGQVVEQNCPDGAYGKAKWTCSSSTSYWYPKKPNFGNCSSLWFGNFVDERMHRISKDESVMNVAEDLAQRTTKRRLYGKDIIEAIFVMRDLVSATKKQSYYYNQNQQKEFMQSLVKVSSNLLDRKQTESWEDLTFSERRFSASTMLENLEENALSLAETQRTGDYFTHAEENVLASVQVVKAQHTSYMVFPQPRDIMGTTWVGMEDSVYIPGSVLQHYSRFSRGYVSVIFVAYNNIESMLKSQSMLIQHNPSQGQHKNLVQKMKQIVNSRIISVSFGNVQSTWLPEPIILTFSSLHRNNATDPRCVFWDFDTNDWSGRGCGVMSFNRSHTVCSCRHLTNFAVLMTIKPFELPSEYSRTLSMITFVGCFISIVSLLLAVITFQCFRSLQSDRTTIHKNLCLCLLVGEVLFVAGINQTAVPILCSIVAGLLHYVFLAAFVWMFLEGFHLYIMLVDVFESEKSRVKWFYLLGYGVPALIVCISAAVDSHSYGTDYHCWLKADNYFIFSFVGPVIAVLLANMVFLSIAVFIMCDHGNLKTSVKAKEQARLTKLGVWIRGALVLVVLLGLTWAFGLLYLNQESVIMAYVFTILNILQGLFIFLFHCVRNEKVQKEYKNLIHQSDWLPNCLCRQRSQEQHSSVATSSVTQPVCSRSSPLQSWVTILGHDKPLVTSSVINTVQDPIISRGINQDRRSSKSSTVSSQSVSEKFHLRNTLGNHILDEDQIEREGKWSVNKCNRPLVPGSVIKNPMKAYDQCRQRGATHLSDYDQRMNSFMDHIYESIDAEQEPLSWSTDWCPPSVSYQHMPSDRHFRCKYSPTQQSTSSFVCDQHPLIPFNLMETKVTVNQDCTLSQMLHSIPKVSPSQVVNQRESPTDSDNSSGSSLDNKGNYSSSTLPAHSTTPSSEFSDGQKTSQFCHRYQPAVTASMNNQDKTETTDSSFSIASNNVVRSDCYPSHSFIATDQTRYPSDIAVLDYPESFCSDKALMENIKKDCSNSYILIGQNKHPIDNTVVMAVLDGDQVVCKLQPEDLT
ncbi:adhesion G protein-coupled receptor L1-like isoform X2 [Tachypleus tridentatus]|uniref:adhesion G protein-coupled receptor L1-like isoform X2 n=1 Tax=Tachypleus tridentatus TaxID=6853 RepID=UPI003FD54C9E